MTSLRLAFALIRIPRLFASLFLLPVIASMVIIYVQLIATGVILETVTSRKNAEAREKKWEQNTGAILTRRILYGQSDKLPPLRVCRWKMYKLVSGEIKEGPPDKACLPDRLDVAIRAADPSIFDVTEYVKAFDGNLQRLHVCATCHPDVVIDTRGTTVRADSSSAMGLLVLSVVTLSDDAHARIEEARAGMERIYGLLGDIFFHAKEFRQPVKINELEVSAALIFNLSFFVIIALWLALKAHRRVLDYFSRNGALLPMVAATGKHAFYSAIWVLTVMRVGCFLLAAGPITWYGFDEYLNKDNSMLTLSDDATELCVWFVALIASLTLATIIASVADLKQRHNFLSFMYRYVPIVICVVGAIVWGGSFVFDAEIFSTLRKTIMCLPLAGVIPVLLAPVFKPQLGLLVISLLFNAGLVALILRLNARWFAAHLEEL